MFDVRFAKRMAARYRKKGLDKTARQMVELLAERGVQGATVLEIGGGVREIQLELLRLGAASATNLELSPGPVRHGPAASTTRVGCGWNGWSRSSRVGRGTLWSPRSRCTGRRRGGLRR